MGRKERTPEVAPPSTPELFEAQYETIVIFKNDDPAPWTDVEVLGSVDDIFVEYGVPLTQCVIPYDMKKDERLDAESGVCQYLVEYRDEETGLFENVLHGYTHARETESPWGSEFSGLPYEEQKQKITAGMEIFEGCFGRAPTTFVPPFNTYDETTVRVLVENGFNLICGGLYFQKEYFEQDGLWQDGEMIHLPTNLSMEDWDVEEVRDIEDLKQEYDRNKETYGFNVIMLHYYFYESESDRQTLEEFVQYAVEDNSRFMTLNEFAQKLNAGELRRTEDGWAVLEQVT